MGGIKEGEDENGVAMSEVRSREREISGKGTTSERRGGGNVRDGGK